MTQNSFLYSQQNNGLDNFACQRQINFLELENRILLIKNTVSFPQPASLTVLQNLTFRETAHRSLLYFFSVSYNKELLSGPAGCSGG